MSHTPGPWSTDEKDHEMPYQDIRVTAESRCICIVWIDDAPVHDYNAEQMANARLIAAAPELMEALQDLMAWQVKNVKCWHNSAYDAAARIVQKATGTK